MLLKVKLLGSGTDRDSYRVNLPTYTHVHGNITEGYALVSIPDNTHNLSESELAASKVADTTEGSLHSLSADHLKKLHDYWDNTLYKQHSGKFRVEQV